MNTVSETTAFGLWRYGKEFAEAADTAYQAARRHPFLPAYYLVGHAR